ncbi:MAG: hypothetical protein ACR2F4_00050, partial [Thermoleophilaceae bacterium]
MASHSPAGGGGAVTGGVVEGGVGVGGGRERSGAPVSSRRGRGGEGLAGWSSCVEGGLDGRLPRAGDRCWARS